MGVGIGEIILTTFLVNFRHFLMAASLTEKLNMRDSGERPWFPLMAHGITDEVFSVASFRVGKLTKEYMLSLEVFSLFGWVGSTVLGYLIGSILPQDIQTSMGVAIYALFIALVLPEAKKSKKIAGLTILSGITNALLTYLDILPQGWSIILSILLVSGLGVLLDEKEEKEGAPCE